MSDGRVEKKKKKKGLKKKDADAEPGEGDQKRSREVSESAANDPSSLDVNERGSETPESGLDSSAKTEAERKYEEVRRKRVRFRTFVLCFLLDCF